MALGTVCLDAERGFAIVACAAELALLHIFHGVLLVLLGDGVELVMTGGAFLSGS
jgi:hypothetical protein